MKGTICTCVRQYCTCMTTIATNLSTAKYSKLQERLQNHAGQHNFVTCRMCGWFIYCNIMCMDMWTNTAALEIKQLRVKTLLPKQHNFSLNTLPFSLSLKVKLNNNKGEFNCLLFKDL